MKKKNLFLLATLCVLAFTVLFAGCGKRESGERFYAYVIQGVEIRQQTNKEYAFYVTLPEDTAAPVFYFTRYDRLKESDTPLQASYADGKYTFSVTALPGDYFLYAKDGSKTAMLPLTIPKMNPSVSAVGAINTVSYELDGSTSWSSFIDPEGKSIYRSASPQFGDSAKPVSENNSILDATTSDVRPSEEEPYYYVVFSGKNGLVRFVSYALIDATKLFDGLSASLTAGADGAPLLRVTGRQTMSDDFDAYSLTVASGDETYSAKNTDSRLSRFTFSLPLGAMKKPDIWYDIHLTENATGKRWSLPASVGTDDTVTSQKKQYSFHEWQGQLKVAFAPVSTLYDVTSVTLTEGEDGRPLVVVAGDLSEGTAQDAVKLAVRYDSGGKHDLAIVENSSGEQGKFLFTFDASAMTIAGNWHDIDIVAGGKNYTIDASLADLTARVEYAGKTYGFEVYDKALKVYFTASAAA